MINRILPLRLKIWKRKRNEKILKRTQLKEKVIEEWVRAIDVHRTNCNSLTVLVNGL